MSHSPDRSLGQRAIVIGGSLAGLFAARVLSDSFDEIVLIERDTIGDRPETRKGQPQTRHLHGLLARGLDEMTEFFPDLPDGLRAGGAILADMGTAMRWHSRGGYRRQFESGMIGVLVSRAFLEWQVRRRVVGLPHVGVRDGCEVSELLTDRDRARVSGVRIVHREDGRDEQLPADLVVDATGRGSATPKWLTALGYPRPPESAVVVRMAYASRVYRRRPGDLRGAQCVMINSHPPHQKRSGFCFPWEDDRWIVTLAGNAGDHCPTDDAGFLDFARSLSAPDIAEIIPRLEPLTEIYTHGFPSNLRRRYERVSRFPEGYLVIGDAVCSFNPVYGQGMTAAAMQAAVLAEVLGKRDSTRGVWREFFPRAGRILDNPWQLALGEDLRFPETVGKRSRGAKLVNAYVDRVQRATHRDPIVYRALLDVMNLQASPGSLFRPRIMWRVLRDARRARKVVNAKAVC